MYTPKDTNFTLVHLNPALYSVSTDRSESISESAESTIEPIGKGKRLVEALNRQSSYTSTTGGVFFALTF